MTNEWAGPYRVLSRRLDGDVERLEAEAPDGHRVVLRRRASRPGATGPVAEAVAFARADHPHVSRLVDVFTGATGELVLAFDDVGGEHLPSWLAARGRPEPGEVVTLVVPVLTAVQHLVRRGVGLSALGVDDVEIDARGAPVLVGLSGAVALGPDAEGASLPVAADFARSVVGRATWPGVGHPTPSLDSTSFESLIESVFDLGAAEPLSSVDVLDVAPSAVDPEARPAHEQPAAAWWALLPESEVVERLVARLPGLRPRSVLSSLRAVRPRFRVLGAGALLVGAAALVIGTSATGDADLVDADPRAAPSVDTNTAAGVVPSTASASPDPDGSSTTDPAGEVAVLGDDVGAAAAVLLQARLDCLRDATPTCLAAVDQPGSPIALRDATVLDDPSRAGDLAFAVDLTGDSSPTGGTVLLGARGPDGEPASVLVMRTEAGWRLRDVFVDG